MFSNATAFTVADATAGGPGVASLYPSPIVVSGMVGTISDVNVTITGLTTARPRDLDVLLVGPGGQTLLLMADAGGTAGCGVTGINLTFDDAAAGLIQENAAGCPPGTIVATGAYRPTNYVFGVETDVFPAPAPAPPHNHPAPTGTATLASIFNTTNPNGTWNLYVVDDSLGGLASTVAGGWSIDITSAGGIDPTTTVVSSNTNPALTTQTITFTSTTTNNTTGLPVTTGTVSFTNNAVAIAGCTGVAVNGSGVATCMTTLAEGTRLIVANYSGTATLGLSSGSVTQVVNSPTVVSGAQFCNNGGLSITDAGTSAPVYPSNISVSNLFGTISKVTVQVNGFTALRPGNIDLLLVGANNAGFTFMSDIGDSINPATSLNFTFDDAAATQPPQAALSTGTFRPADYDPAADPDTFPAPAPGGISQPGPAGASTFASVYNSSNPNGTWSLYAVDDGIGGGSSTIASWCLNFIVTPFSTTTAVTSNANPSVFGQPVTFTATVTSAGGTPSGNVQFFDGASPIGGPVALNGSGVATVTTSALSVGNHTITAQYAGVTLGAGGGGFASSNGSMTGNPQVVNQASTTTTVTSAGTNPVGTNIPVTFTATVSPVAPGAGTRTGTVTFSRNGSPVSSCVNVAINASGQATCQITFTVAGNYNITAAYSGDANFTASNNNASPFVQQVVGPSAANVGVSGRVLDTQGRGVSGAIVAMQSQEGVVVFAITNPFGYYRFANVPSGQSYLVSVEHKRFEFQPRTVTVNDELSGVDFIAESGSSLGGAGKQSTGRRP